MMASLRWRARALPFSSPPVGLIDVHSAARARARGGRGACPCPAQHTPSPDAGPPASRSSRSVRPHLPVKLVLPHDAVEVEAGQPLRPDGGELRFELLRLRQARLGNAVPLSSEPLFFFARRSMVMAEFAEIQLRTGFQLMGSASGPEARDARCSLTRAVASVMPAPASTTAMMMPATFEPTFTLNACAHGT